MVKTSGPVGSIAEILGRPTNGVDSVHIHLVGIGGSGLSAIATVLLQNGYHVSGSDLARSVATDSLEVSGTTIFIGHAADQVACADLVLVSSAVPCDNVEVGEARRRGIPVSGRPEFLGWLTSGHETIAIAGTHGKTTTTAMIAWVLVVAGRDPSYVVGGVLPELGGNARAGLGQYFVLEADEYDRTFLGLNPRIAVITNVEWDHVDCYGTPSECHSAFFEFAQLLPEEGLLVVCADDAGASELGEFRVRQCRPTISYGLRPGAQWHATKLVANDKGGTDFMASCSGRGKHALSLRVPGRHNVLNSLAAMAVADYLEVPLDTIAGALSDFSGVKRRFELKGEIEGVSVIDDYAHHPTEIGATLSAAKQRYPERSVWAVFQPHTYSRTRALLDEFARSFAQADHVVVTDIYAAREQADSGPGALHITDRMDHPDARHISGLQETCDFLLQRLQPGDVLITLGAGDGYRVGECVLSGLKGNEDAERTALASS